MTRKAAAIPIPGRALVLVNPFAFEEAGELGIDYTLEGTVRWARTAEGKRDEAEQADASHLLILSADRPQRCL